MNKIFFYLLLITTSVVAQDKGVFITRESGYLQNVILKENQSDQISVPVKAKRRVFIMDQSTYQLPNKKSLYTYAWHLPPISQGSTGTCWCFSTISFYESEIKRLTNREIKLSEMFVVYYEYLAKATRFIETKGTSLFDEGSEANAVKRIIKTYGIVPAEVYTAKPANQHFYFHDSLVSKMKHYLDSIKHTNNWDESANISEIKKILQKEMGEIPETFKWQGKKYTPLTFLEFLQFNPDDYVDILSYKQNPFFKSVEYKVPDNWWHDSSYYNVPLDTFMYVLKHVIKQGYTVCVGGDISEAGINSKTQCAMVPSFDIPASAINDDARQFRFNNGTTTDDHGMHVVGYYEYDGKTWFLFKDSGSGSRNNDETKPEFGYYFFSEDFVKLKMMDFHVNKSALKGLLPIN